MVTLLVTIILPKLEPLGIVHFVATGKANSLIFT